MGAAVAARQAGCDSSQYPHRPAAGVRRITRGEHPVCHFEVQEGAFHLWMLSKFFSTMVKTASLALGKIPSVPEKSPVEDERHAASFAESAIGEADSVGLDELCPCSLVSMIHCCPLMMLYFFTTSAIEHLAQPLKGRGKSKRR
jgi:hypothetical protein